MNGRINKSDIIEDILRVYNIDKIKFNIEFYKKNGKFSPKPAIRIFGSWSMMLKELNLPILRSRYGVTKEEVIEDVKSVFCKNGSINKKIYERDGKFSNDIYVRLFDGFTKLLIESGIKPNYASYGYSYEELLEIVKDIYDKYGIISHKLITSETNIPRATIINRVGKLQDLYNAINANYYPVSEQFRKILDIVIEYLDEKPILEWKHDKLINPKTNANLRIDAYFSKHNIAIEYDGEQHFKYKPHYHKTYDFFLYRQYLDQLKNSIINELKIPLIRFKYNDKIDKDFILLKLKPIVTK